MSHMAGTVKFLTVQNYHNIVWLKYMGISPQSAPFSFRSLLPPHPHETDFTLTHKAKPPIL